MRRDTFIRHAKTISVDSQCRVSDAVHDALDLYANRVRYGFYEMGTLSAITYDLGKIIDQMLQLKTLSNNEIFQVSLEEQSTFKKNNNFNADIIIKHRYVDHSKETLFLVEINYEGFEQISDNIVVKDAEQGKGCGDSPWNEEVNIDGTFYIHFEKTISEMNDDLQFMIYYLHTKPWEDSRYCD